MSNVTAQIAVSLQGQHMAGFGAAIEQAFGFRPDLAVVPVRAGAKPRVRSNRARGVISVTFALGNTALAGQISLSGLKDPGSAKAILVNLVPLARTILELEIADQQQRSHITELNRLNAVLEHRAQRDPLTGLLNHETFRPTVQARLAHHVPGTSSTLILADLDDFKAVNDAHGHAFGDLYIRTFARVLTTATRQNDLTARIGGDEFVIFLQDLPLGRATLDRFIARLRNSFGQAIAGHGVRGLGKVSFGAVTFGGGASYDDLFNGADAALYRSKREGRDRMTVAE